jgi:hypothetical protein
MQMRETATTDTTALIERLLATQAEQSVREIQAVQPLIATALQQLEDAVATVRVGAAAEVATLVDRLAAEAATETAAAVATANAEAQVVIDGLQEQVQMLTGERDDVSTTLASANKQIDDISQRLHSQMQAVDALRKEQKEAIATIEALHTTNAALEARRDELDAAKTEAEKSLEAEQLANTELAERLAAEHDQKVRLEQALATEQATRAAGEDELVALRTKVEQLSNELGHAQVERDTIFEERQAVSAEHTRAIVDLQARLDAAVSAEARLRKQAAAKPVPAREKEKEKGSEPREDVRQVALGYLGQSFDGLVKVAEAMADAATMDHVLNAMVDSLSAEFSRVALFRVQRNRLEGVREIGFQDHVDLSNIVIPRTIDSLMTRAVKSGRVETLSGTEVADASGTPFGGTPTAVLALPIVVDGEAFAVVYADDAGEKGQAFGSPELRTKFAELLQQYSAPLLARLSAELKSLAGMREYATLLVDELEYTYSAQVGSVTDDARRESLEQNLDCARGLYLERARAEGPRAAKILDEQLQHAIKTHHSAPFGRDLAKLVSGTADRDRDDVSAEASAQAS